MEDWVFDYMMMKIIWNINDGFMCRGFGLTQSQKINL
jgi:hypothetical protein